MEDLTGISGNKIFGQKLFDFFPDFSEESIQLRLEMVFFGGTPIVFSSLLHRTLFLGKDSENANKYFEVIANSFKLENGTVSLLFTVKDVTELNLQILKFREMRDKALAEVELRKTVELELRSVNKKLETIASTDPLTGLYNRRYIIGKMEEEVLRSKRHSRKYSVIISDIDHFKNFNDTYGHDCGDYVLQQISAIMQKNLRSIDTISRWGGEEFLVFLPETVKEDAAEIAEKLRSTIYDYTFSYDKQKLKVSMTFGVSEQNDLEDDVNVIIKRADTALYDGKKKNRNCVIIAG